MSTNELHEAIKNMSVEDQEIILKLADVFKGEENIIIEYIKKELK